MLVSHLQNFLRTPQSAKRTHTASWGTHEPPMGTKNAPVGFLQIVDSIVNTSKNSCFTLFLSKKLMPPFQSLLFISDVLETIPNVYECEEQLISETQIFYFNKTISLAPSPAYETSLRQNSKPSKMSIFEANLLPNLSWKKNKFFEKCVTTENSKPKKWCFRICKTFYALSRVQNEQTQRTHALTSSPWAPKTDQLVFFKLSIL